MCFSGINFRVPGNRASNIPMVNVPVEVLGNSRMPGNIVFGVGTGFGIDPAPHIDAEPTPLGTRGALWLPGTAENILVTPDYTEELNLKGNLDIISLVTPDDWYRTSFGIILSKMGATGNMSWQLSIGNRNLYFVAWYEDGTKYIQTTIPLPEGIEPNTPKWVRATLIKNNVSGLAEVNVMIKDVNYIDEPIPKEWVSLGTQTGDAMENTFHSDVPVAIGGAYSHSSNFFKGKIYRVILKDGIEGRPVINADF